nr:unnamed protein product [Callosobruchus chinensis]
MYVELNNVSLQTNGLTQPGASATIDLTQQQVEPSQQQVNFVSSNDIEKPVDEIQEFVPTQTQGGQTAIIPLLPPPATPVQITRPNTPANGGAVFLGSGALGVVALGGGAYVLGSGGLGYSNRRSNPRASFRHPLLPPVRASADLIPAAVNAPQMQQFQGIQFNYPPGKIKT